MHHPAPFRYLVMQGSFLQHTSPTLSPNSPSGRHGATDRKWGWSPTNPTLFVASGVTTSAAGPGVSGILPVLLHWPGADRHGHIGAGWSSDVITGEEAAGGPGNPDPARPAHATSGRTWLVASLAAALRRRHPGSGSELGSASLSDLTRSSRPAQAPSDWLPACLLPGESSPVAPATESRSVLAPSSLGGCRAGEPGGIAESRQCVRKVSVK